MSDLNRRSQSSQRGQMDEDFFTKVNEVDEGLDHPPSPGLRRRSPRISPKRHPELTGQTVVSQKITWAQIKNQELVNFQGRWRGPLPKVQIVRGIDTNAALQIRRPAKLRVCGPGAGLRQDDSTFHFLQVRRSCR